MITISQKPETHLIICVERGDYDSTVQRNFSLAVRRFMQILEYDQAEEAIKKIAELKRMWSETKRMQER
jgi:hypothetical protein